MARWIGKVIPPLLPLIVVAALAEIAVRRGWVPAYLVPAPSKVLRSLVAWSWC